MNILEYENYKENKVHTKKAFPYNTYICTIPLDFEEVPEHWHEEAEFIYIKKGSGIISVDFQDHALTAPALVFVLPGQLHGIRRMGSERMEYENILFDPEMLRPRHPDTTDTDFIQPLLNGQVGVPSVFTPDSPDYERIIAPIDDCDKICSRQPQGYELFIKSQLFLFFYTLNRQCQSRPPYTADRRQKLDRMRHILKYIEHHYAQPVSIADISRIAGFSESHFMRYFKEHTGNTFVEYLRDYRLTMAARLLRASEETILTIALEAGFENLSYFNRSFRKKYQMTPGQYRKNGQKGD